jgi:hypothetical protein
LAFFPRESRVPLAASSARRWQSHDEVNRGRLIVKSAFRQEIVVLKLLTAEDYPVGHDCGTRCTQTSSDGSTHRESAPLEAQGESRTARGLLGSRRGLQRRLLGSIERPSYCVLRLRIMRKRTRNWIAHEGTFAAAHPTKHPAPQPCASAPRQCSRHRSPR